MFNIDINKLTDEELIKYCKKVFSLFETDHLAHMTAEELEETDIYAEAMCIQSIFDERNLRLSI
mgnify:FL=1